MMDKKVSTSGVLVLLGVIIDSELTMLTKTLSPFIPSIILYVFATKHAVGLLKTKYHLFTDITTNIRSELISLMNNAETLNMIKANASF